MKRLISDPKINLLYLQEPQKHEKSTMAPKSILEFSKKNEISFINNYNNVLNTLKACVGDPYFAENGFILYNMDAESFMNSLYKAGIGVNLTITSPPYNIGKPYEKIIPPDKYIEWCTEWMNSIFNITKDIGAFWLNLGYFSISNKGKCIPISYLLWDKSPFFLQQEIVWTYEAGVSAKKRLAPRNEKWLFYSKQEEQYIFNLDDIRDPNVKYPNQKKNGKYRCNPLGKNPGDVWFFPKVTTGKNRSSKERTEHPAQFPLSVIERIIKVSSNIGDVIYDPFAGSCSTGIASSGLSRIFIGTEINKSYCIIAVDRFKKFQKEQKKQISLLALVDNL